MKVDSREPKHIARWFKRKGWKVDVEKFEIAGDIADDKLQVIFERKNGTDVVASVYDGRLVSQCHRLYEIGERRDSLNYVVISGDLVQSVDTYTTYVWKGLRKSDSKFRVPRKKFHLKITTPQIYKIISMLPWHYDVNVLWFITEVEALETMHYMLQEVGVSDPFSKTLSKRRRSKAKRKAKSRRKTGSPTVHRTNAGRTRASKPSVVAKTGTTDETDYERFKRLGLL